MALIKLNHYLNEIYGKTVTAELHREQLIQLTHKIYGHDGLLYLMKTKTEINCASANNIQCYSHFCKCRHCQVQCAGQDLLHWRLLKIQYRLTAGCIRVTCVYDIWCSNDIIIGPCSYWKDRAWFHAMVAGVINSVENLWPLDKPLNSY